MDEPPVHNKKTRSTTSISTTRRWIAATASVLGFLIFAWGLYLETRNPRSNVEDAFAWLVLGIGVSVGAFGVALRFFHPVRAVMIAFVAPPVAFCAAVALYWVCLIGYSFHFHGHQDFAANGVSQIPPAAQMGQLFDDCRHYITYGPNDVPLFNSVAYFGGRYELTMQVAVTMESETSGSMTGEPQFYLNEISAVTSSPSGQVGALFSRNLEFGYQEWKRVYSADGDFSTIGFNVNPMPVADCQKYTDAARPLE